MTEKVGGGGGREAREDKIYFLSVSSFCKAQIQQTTFLNGFSIFKTCFLGWGPGTMFKRSEKNLFPPLVSVPPPPLPFLSCCLEQFLSQHVYITF